jgi:hypothetical protein
VALPAEHPLHERERLLVVLDHEYACRASGVVAGEDDPEEFLSLEGVLCVEPLHRPGCSQPTRGARIGRLADP